MASGPGREPFAESSPEEKAGDSFWEAYLNSVESEDKALEVWAKESGIGHITFVSLLAWTIAIVINKSKVLSNEKEIEAQIVALLAQRAELFQVWAQHSGKNHTDALFVQSNSSSNSTVHPPVPLFTQSNSSSNSTVPPFVLPEVPPHHVRTQWSRTDVIAVTLWLCSLLLSLACGALINLAQGWTLNFLHVVRQRDSRTTIKKYAFNDLRARSEANRYGLKKIPALVEFMKYVALVLFCIGLAVYIFPILPAAGGVTTAFAVVLTLIWGICCLPNRVQLRMMVWLASQLEKIEERKEEVRATMGEVTGASGAEVRASGEEVEGRAEGGAPVLNDDKGETAADEDIGERAPMDEDEEEIQEVPRDEDVTAAGNIMMRRLRPGASHVIAEEEGRAGGRDMARDEDEGKRATDEVAEDRADEAEIQEVPRNEDVAAGDVRRRRRTRGASYDDCLV